MATPTKLITTLQGDQGQRATDPELRTGLREAGCHRLQVNVQDASIADTALRLSTHDVPITAVVSAWPTDATATEAAAEVLAGLGPVWQVEERIPLEPPAVADGVPADALANVALLRRPAGLTREEWLARWLGSHTQVAIDTQATSGYVQNVVVGALTSDAPPVEGIVEELFPLAAMGDLHAFYGSGGDRAELDRRLRAMLASVATFGADRDLDVVPTRRTRWDLTRPGA